MRVVVRFVIWTWFLAALAAGRWLWLPRLPASGLVLISLALTVLLLAVGLGVPRIRAWLHTLDPRSLVILHAARFYGLYALDLYHRRILPRSLVLPGAWWDIAVATLALALVFLPLKDRLLRPSIFIWNTAGLTSLVLTVLAAVEGIARQPWRIAVYEHLPLCLLPLFILPLLLATHVIIYLRLARSAPGKGVPA